VIVDPYFYDNGTLRNRFGVRDRDELAAIEYEITAVRIAEIERSPLDGGFDLTHLQAVHRYLFGDVYEWAGELRTVEISKGDATFCLVRFIVPASEQVFASVPTVLRDLRSGGGLVPVSLADLYADVNALHPFREGNGRAQRAFIGLLCRKVGVRLDWGETSAGGNIEASLAAHRGDNSGFQASSSRRTSLSLTNRQNGSRPFEADRPRRRRNKRPDGECQQQRIGRGCAA